jgi:hypothetical protein
MWTAQQISQLSYLFYGISQVALSSTILRASTPRFMTVSTVEIEFTKAPALLFAASGAVDFIIGAGGYRRHRDLASRGFNLVKTIKICMHMAVCIASYAGYTGLYASATGVAVFSALVPLFVSGFLFIVVDYHATTAILLRTHQIREASRLELLFPLLVSLVSFGGAQGRLLEYLYPYIGDLSPVGRAARGVFQINVLFGVLYAAHVLCLNFPLMFTNYKLECMAELLMVVMRVLFCANLPYS